MHKLCNMLVEERKERYSVYDIIHSALRLGSNITEQDIVLCRVGNASGFLVSKGVKELIESQDLVGCGFPIVVRRERTISRYGLNPMKEMMMQRPTERMVEDKILFRCIVTETDVMQKQVGRLPVWVDVRIK